MLRISVAHSLRSNALFPMHTILPRCVPLSRVYKSYAPFATLRSQIPTLTTHSPQLQWPYCLRWVTVFSLLDMQVLYTLSPSPHVDWMYSSQWGAQFRVLNNPVSHVEKPCSLCPVTASHAWRLFLLRPATRHQPLQGRHRAEAYETIQCRRCNLLLLLLIIASKPLHLTRSIYWNRDAQIRGAKSPWQLNFVRWRLIYVGPQCKTSLTF
jgi:hypothetical protein